MVSVVSVDSAAVPSVSSGIKLNVPVATVGV